MQDDPVGFLKSVERYVDIHSYLFGTYEGELFQRPSEEIVKSASGTFQQWLQNNDLLRLLPMFGLLTKSLGYE